MSIQQNKCRKIN